VEETGWSTEPGANPDEFGEPGPPLDHHAPFYVGFVGASGALLAFWLATNIATISSTLVLIVVAFFIAAGLNPSVEWIEGHGVRRRWAVTTVIVAVIIAVTLFFVAIVPVITDQVASITDNAPGWLEQLQENRRVQDLDDEYQVIDKIRDYVTGGDFVSTLFGGALGFGLAVLGALFNGFIILVLTLYFLSSLAQTKSAFYRLAPASRRERVTRLGDKIIRSVGGYVSGAFIVALFAGVSSLIFLFIVGLGQYAVALSFVVALLTVIPMIGATIGAVVVSAIAFAEDPKIGIACVIFYVIYQQVENYVIYPRVMSKSVDVPGAVTVIAALIGAALLGVVGALLAIPTAAALLMLTREVFVRRQDDR
jgi:predicted PurR-regulated permease PerM